MKKDIIVKLKLSSVKEVYLYMKDGTPIYTHFSIPEEEKSIFVGTAPCFCGLERLFLSQKSRQNLYFAIFSLE